MMKVVNVVLRIKSNAERLWGHRLFTDVKRVVNQRVILSINGRVKARQMIILGQFQKFAAYGESSKSLHEQVLRLQLRAFGVKLE
jgi:hypothetical protein